MMKTPGKQLLAVLIMAVIAVCAAGFLHFYGELGWATSVIAAIAGVSLVLSATVFSRQTRFLKQAGSLLDGVRDFEKDIDRRIAKLSDQVLDDDAINRMARKIEALEAELDILSQKGISVTPALETPIEDADPSSAADNNPFKALANQRADEEEVISSEIDEGEIKESLLNHGLEMFLQPVLMLPEQKISHYEALARLSDGGEGYLETDQVPDRDDALELAPEIDRQMLVRILELLRRLESEGREAGVFWSVSKHTLSNASIFKAIKEQLRNNKALASKIHPELTMRDYQFLNAEQMEALEYFSSMGITLSMAACNDLKTARQAGACGLFSHIRSPAKELLRYQGATAETLGNRLSAILATSGVRLVATDVESEEQVMNVMDYDIAMAQGNLFSEPRPIKSRYAGPSVENTGT